jgi:tripartite-type tricarboxylate transporter receptor subunit TctC
MVELLGGHIEAVCCSVPEAASQIEGRQVRVLAVMSSERLPDFSDIPTVKESDVAWEAIGWRGIMLPKSAPLWLVERLEKELRAIADSPEYRDFMKKNAFGIVVRGPQEFSTFLEAQDAQWHKVIVAAGYARP